MGLKFSYTLLAPLYAANVAAPTDKIRIESLRRLYDCHNQNVLINGIGTGQDIPTLPSDPGYADTGIAPAMLRIAPHKPDRHQVNKALQPADRINFPHDDASVGIVGMHLILAVVPQASKSLLETSCVLGSAGRLFIMDKLHHSGKTALLRRLINPVMRRLATRTDVLFKELHHLRNNLQLLSDQPISLKQWLSSLEKRDMH